MAKGLSITVTCLRISHSFSWTSVLSGKTTKHIWQSVSWTASIFWIAADFSNNHGSLFALWIRMVLNRWKELLALYSIVLYRQWQNQLGMITIRDITGGGMHLFGFIFISSRFRIHLHIYSSHKYEWYQFSD